MISMSRAETTLSNIAQPTLQPWRFYEKEYTTAGPQEWITLPDCGPVKVVLSFPSGPGSAFIEGTASPYDAVLPNDGAVNPIGAYSPIVYPLTDTVTDITPLLVQGETAIRINNVGGICAVSVRC